MRRPSRSALVPFAVLHLAAVAVLAQRPANPTRIAVEELFPHGIGDRWLFGSRDGQPAGARMVGEPRDLYGEPLGAGFVLETDEGELSVLRLDPEQGLLLVATAGLDPANRRYVPPLAVLPAVLEAGAQHVAESEVIESVDRAEVRRGVRRVQASIGAPSPLQTPSGEWLAWPVVTETRTEWSGEPPTTTRTETWYARGVGPVGRRVGAGGDARLELLLEAKIGDRPIPP